MGSTVSEHAGPRIPMVDRNLMRINDYVDYVIITSIRMLTRMMVRLMRMLMMGTLFLMKSMNF